ncbi:MAG: M23 family metallopeptidase [Ilumatobacter sp.]|nr:MAG: M23 family metallopeptidase [Ilumatobacter sp.]
MSPLIRRQRPLVAALALIVVLVVPGSPVGGPAAAAGCWHPPVVAPVVDPFREPACPWCPGNRGLEYGTGAGMVVRAVAAGRVSFSGDVAGTGYVVVRHADGLRATYGGIVGIRLVEGDPVAARARVGVTDRNLHFGLRDGDVYLDPAPYLGRLVYRARLVPLDSTVARAAPPPRLRCGTSVARPASATTRYTHVSALPARAVPTHQSSSPHPPRLRSPEGARGRVP